MDLLISIKDSKISLNLLKNKKILDFLDMADEYKLSEELLPAIDKILNKNKLKPENIRKIKVKGDQGDNFTTTRIAKSVANAWNWSQKEK